jgi:eukaryotic-like serine/threonine-protein kinase
MVTSSIDSPVHEGDVINGKYVVDAVIGVGGMGVVVSARHAELGQQVALKFLLPQALGIPGAVERFIREARSAVQLQSQHVARVYDVGRVEGGTPFLVMELLHGCDLGTLVKNNGPLRVGDVAEYVIQACEAVAEAHALGIVHRDLKPANLFLTRRVNGAPLVKVLDFGISKVTNLQPTDPSLTKTSDVVGSPYYMAPEQVRSARDVDARTDIWALGVILYELLAGEVPFLATNVPQLCAMVLETEPAPLIQVRPDIPESLNQIVLTCLAKLPEQRFASVQDLVRALAPFAATGTDGVSSPPMPIPEPRGVAELPPVPVRSSMTLGETMQQDSQAGPLRSSPPVGHSAAPVQATSGADYYEPTLNNVSDRVGATGPAVERGAPGSTGLTWDHEAHDVPKRRSWLLWAVPLVGLTTATALAAAIWAFRSASDVSDLTDVAAPSVSNGGPTSSALVDDAASANVPAPTTLGTPTAEASAAPATSTTKEPERPTPTHPAPAVTKTVAPTPTKTAAPVKTGAGEDFLPSDRK